MVRMQHAGLVRVLLSWGLVGASCGCRKQTALLQSTGIICSMPVTLWHSAGQPQCESAAVVQYSVLTVPVLPAGLAPKVAELHP
jgi:hypothetical protein